MDKEELMFGDWVMNRISRKPMQIKSPSEMNYAKVMEPIPLTAEILERNGFLMYDEKDKAYRWELEEGVFINVDFKSDEPFVAVVNTCYQVVPYCVHVHQLQHALRLAGIKKEIKL